MARKLEHPPRDDIRLDTVLAALADITRREIVCRLNDSLHERPLTAFELPISKSTMTHHFRVLREAGLIQQRYEGTAILSALRREDLDARFPGLLEAVFTAEHIENQSLPRHQSSTRQ